MVEVERRLSVVDEPADVLLERIRAEREAAAGRNGRRRGTVTRRIGSRGEVTLLPLFDGV